MSANSAETSWTRRDKFDRLRRVLFLHMKHGRSRAPPQAHKPTFRVLHKSDRDTATRERERRSSLLLLLLQPNELFLQVSLGAPEYM